MRVCVPQAAVAGFQHPTLGLIKARDGIITVPDHIGRQLVELNDCWQASDKPKGSVGFVCEDCGFHAYFRTCGKCGGACHRPNKEAHDGQEQAA